MMNQSNAISNSPHDQPRPRRCGQLTETHFTSRAQDFLSSQELTEDDRDNLEDALTKLDAIYKTLYAYSDDVADFLTQALDDLNDKARYRADNPDDHSGIPYWKTN